ncbi:NINE protein [Vacuolonema iberomarrocanum]|uniref:NINE protein n=1 Tax=Vacuolonema iberomarrocanum TaxID=3454632 RepID=UPI0019DDEA48|nr:NINE protein [filamentous cyanobacterium LEGE 07170]
MQRVNYPTAYLLWALSIFGVCGIHRLYTGRILSGVIYLFTFGIVGFGQLIDLFLIPGMVDQRNQELLRLQGGMNPVIMPVIAQSRVVEAPRPTQESSPMQKLLRAAHEYGGILSPAQAALSTELDAAQLRELLYEAERLGYVETTNDPVTGAIRYRFDL